MRPYKEMTSKQKIDYISASLKYTIEICNNYGATINYYRFSNYERAILWLHYHPCYEIVYTSDDKSLIVVN